MFFQNFIKIIRGTIRIKRKIKFSGYGGGVFPLSTALSQPYLRLQYSFFDAVFCQYLQVRNGEIVGAEIIFPDLCFLPMPIFCTPTADFGDFFRNW
jgi:hypothetical protein